MVQCFRNRQAGGRGKEEGKGRGEEGLVPIACEVKGYLNTSNLLKLLKLLGTRAFPRLLNLPSASNLTSVVHQPFLNNTPCIKVI